MVIETFRIVSGYAMGWMSCILSVMHGIASVLSYNLQNAVLVWQSTKSRLRTPLESSDEGI